MPDVTADTVDECVSAGMLRYDAPTYAFRHELVRQSVLSGVTPGRLGALHWQVLDRLRVLPMSPRPLARLAEHADMAGDAPAILEFAIAAGDSAASLGSHREAAFQYGRAMPHADLLDVGARIELLGKRAYECQVADQHEHAIAAWNQQLVLLREAGRTLEAVDALLGLDQSYYTIGDNSPGTSLIEESFALLEGTGPSAHLARTVRYRGAHHLRASEYSEAVLWLEKALVMARDVGARDVEARALASLGITHLLTGEAQRASEEVYEGLQIAMDIGDEDMAGNTYQSVAWIPWMQFDFPEAHARMEEAVRYTADHDLNGHLMCALASAITMKLDLGRWDEAMTEAHDLLYVRNTGRASRIEPLMAIGLLGARRGDRDDVWTYLDEARDYIAKTQTLGYQGTVALARGEAHLLEGDDEAVRGDAFHWYEESVRLWDEELVPELTMLVWRAGLIDAPRRVCASPRCCP